MPAQRDSTCVVSVRPFLVLLLVLYAVAARPANGNGTAGVAADRLESILALAADYVVRYSAEASVVVTQEHYVQQALEQGFFEINGRVREERQIKRTLDSEIVLVRNPDPTDNRYPFLEFRDVIAVDGKAVPDRQERVSVLFLDPTTWPSASRIRTLADASARYNVGSYQRNLNLPSLALLFLHSNNRSRCGCRLTGTETLRGVEVLRISCAERQQPTLIAQTFSGANLPAELEYWLRVADGTVCRTVLRAGHLPAWSAEVTVDYAASSATDVWLPANMREDYVDRGSRERVEATAVYRDTKKFVTSARVVPK